MVSWARAFAPKARGAAATTAARMSFDSGLAYPRAIWLGDFIMSAPCFLYSWPATSRDRNSVLAESKRRGISRESRNFDTSVRIKRTLTDDPKGRETPNALAAVREAHVVRFGRRTPAWLTLVAMDSLSRSRVQLAAADKVRAGLATRVTRVSRSSFSARGTATSLPLATSVRTESSGRKVAYPVRCT